MFEVIDGGKMPTRATKYSACVDLYAKENVEINAGDTKIIPLGVKIDLDKLLNNTFGKSGNYVEWHATQINHFFKSNYLSLHIRSGLASKGLIQNNGEGIVDIDFMGELGLIVSYHIGFISFFKKLFAFKNPFKHYIKAGDRVAQCTLMEHKGYLMGIDSEGERVGGFGSSGVN